MRAASVALIQFVDDVLECPPLDGKIAGGCDEDLDHPLVLTWRDIIQPPWCNNERIL
jgi:hypothetical protein